MYTYLAALSKILSQLHYNFTKETHNAPSHSLIAKYTGKAICQTTLQQTMHASAKAQ